MPVEDVELIEHQEHGRELRHKSDAIRQRMNVIKETNQSNQRQPENKPRIIQPEKRCIKPDTKQKDDTTATQHNSFVRTTQIRLINDVEPVGHTKVCQFKHNQQNKNNCQNHILILFKESSKLTI